MFVRLSYNCESSREHPRTRRFVCMQLTKDSLLDINALPEPAEAHCNVVNDVLCSFVLRDTFTIVLDIWIAIQLTWLSMLCVVQLMQISRNLTTYENMKGHSAETAYPNSQALTSALAAGTTSLEAAGLSSAGQGPNPNVQQGHVHGGAGKRGCLQQLKAILGIDAFFAATQGGMKDDRRFRRRRNPFSRGVAGNCRDFWCDPAPYFGKREPGAAMLGGEIVNYNTMYEIPPKMRSGYRSLADDDTEANV